MIVGTSPFDIVKRGKCQCIVKKNRFNDTSSYSTTQNSYICQMELSPSFHSQSGQLLFVLLQTNPHHQMAHCIVGYFSKHFFLEELFFKIISCFFFWFCCYCFLVLIPVTDSHYLTTCYIWSLISTIHFLFLLQILGILFTSKTGSIFNHRS